VASRDRPTPRHDHRAISVQLVPVSQGQSRVLAAPGPGWSPALAAGIGRIPKLIVRGGSEPYVLKAETH